jgi:hypothetical protein
MKAFRAFVWAVIAALAAVAACSIVAGGILSTWPADAHEAQPTAAKPQGWAYPLSCCSNFDCKQVANGSVKERPEGYEISTGEIVGYQDKRIRHSPDGEFHWCAHQSGVDAGRTICLFVPPRSF